MTKGRDPLRSFMAILGGKRDKSQANSILELCKFPGDFTVDVADFPTLIEFFTETRPLAVQFLRLFEHVVRLEKLNLDDRTVWQVARRGSTFILGVLVAGSEKNPSFRSCCDRLAKSIGAEPLGTVSSAWVIVGFPEP